MNFLSAVGDFAGGMLGSAASFLGDRYAMRHAQAFEREMSGTSHQRQVADLRAAGLNPILSATGGGGASYHGVAASPMGSNAVSSAVGARRLGVELQNIRQDTEKKYMETELSERTAVRTAEETRRIIQDRKNLEVEGELLKQRLRTGGSAEAAARVEENIDRSTAGQILRWINRFSESVQGAGSSARAVREGAGQAPYRGGYGR